jgi:hypothetical protein
MVYIDYGIQPHLFQFTIYIILPVKIVNKSRYEGPLKLAEQEPGTK